jgi:murein DD-endopeptidase MepM/ murein hydrolase activator NlpD
MTQTHLIRARMDPIIDRWNHTPSIPPTAGYLSSGFGIRLSPFSRVNEQGEGLLGYHTGFDITNAEGTPIQATADGEVAAAGWMDRYGNGVILRHSEQFETLYAHMSRVRVKVGQKVSRGDILGEMGRTGNATGVHLHYEVHLNGRPVNPQPYLRLQGEWLKGLR